MVKWTRRSYKLSHDGSFLLLAFSLSLPLTVLSEDGAYVILKCSQWWNCTDDQLAVVQEREDKKGQD